MLFSKKKNKHIKKIKHILISAGTHVHKSVIAEL